MTKKILKQVFRSLFLTFLTLYFIACQEKVEPSAIAPEISNVSQQPDAVNSVIIVGTNFSNTPEKNIVKFNDVIATVIEASTTKITAQIPEGVPNGTVSVSVGGSAGTSKIDFLFGCPDVIISNMSISNVSGNSFLVTYSIKNVGTVPMNLSHMYIQSYVSADNTYGSGDQPAGGFADYGSAEPLLQPNEVRQKTQSITANVSIVTYPYVIFQLLSSQSGPSPECSTANNSASKIIQVGCPDAIISDMSISNVSGNSFLVTYDIKNVGTVPMDLSHMYIQSYVSADNTYGSGDQAAGGFADYGSAEPLLQPNEVRQKTQSITANVSIVTYPYVIFQLLSSQAGPSPECSTANNSASKIIQVGCPDAIISDMSISNISGNSFLVTYDIKNVGTVAMDLSHMYIQSYVSTDNTYGGGDQAAGGFADYGSAEPLLQPNEVRQKTQSITANVNIVTYPYIIFQLLSSQAGPSPECSTTNNSASKIIQAGCPDAIISDMSISNISGNSFLVTYDIKNVGTVAMDLSHNYIQSYVSTDNTYGGGDQAAGGFADYGSAEPLLQPNEVRQKTQSITANVNIVTYPYIIFQLLSSQSGPSPECSTTNNSGSKLIQ